MPYQTGKLKGQLTTPEIRKLISAHNKLTDIIIPKGSTRVGIIVLLKNKGWTIDHAKQSLIREKVTTRKKITLQKAEIVTKPKPKTELQKQKQQEKKQEKEIIKKKEIREIKKKAIEEQKSIPKPKPKSKPVKKTTFNLKNNKVISGKSPPPQSAVPKDSHVMPDGTIMKNKDMKKKNSSFQADSTPFIGKSVSNAKPTYKPKPKEKPKPKPSPKPPNNSMNLQVGDKVVKFHDRYKMSSYKYNKKLGQNVGEKPLDDISEGGIITKITGKKVFMKDKGQTMIKNIIEIKKGNKSVEKPADMTKELGGDLPTENYGGQSMQSKPKPPKKTKEERQAKKDEKDRISKRTIELKRVKSIKELRSAIDTFNSSEALQIKAEGKALKKALRIKGRDKEELIDTIIAYNIDKVVEIEIPPPTQNKKMTDEEKQQNKKVKQEADKVQREKEKPFKGLVRLINQLYAKYNKLLRDNQYKDVKSLLKKMQSEYDEAFEKVEEKEDELDEDVFDNVEQLLEDRKNELKNIAEKGLKGEFTEEFKKAEKAKKKKELDK